MYQPEQYNGLFGLPCLALLFTHWLLHYLCLFAGWHLMGFWNTQKQQLSTSAVYCVSNILFTNTPIPLPRFIRPAQYITHFITCIYEPSPKPGLPIFPPYAFYLLCRHFYYRLCWLKLPSAGYSALTGQVCSGLCSSSHCTQCMPGSTSPGLMPFSC